MTSHTLQHWTHWSNVVYGPDYSIALDQISLVPFSTGPNFISPLYHWTKFHKSAVALDRLVFVRHSNGPTCIGLLQHWTDLGWIAVSLVRQFTNFHVHCVGAWTLPCSALADRVQRCCTELFHAFSLNYVSGCIAHKTGRLVQPIHSSRLLFIQCQGSRNL